VITCITTMIAFMAAARDHPLLQPDLRLPDAEARALLPAHLNVEEDVGPIKTFIQDTNCIIMKRTLHGAGTERVGAYHDCVLVRRQAQHHRRELCAPRQGAGHISEEEMAYMARTGRGDVSKLVKKAG